MDNCGNTTHTLVARILRQQYLAKYSADRRLDSYFGSYRADPDHIEAAWCAVGQAKGD